MALQRPFALAVEPQMRWALITVALRFRNQRVSIRRHTAHDGPRQDRDHREWVWVTSDEPAHEERKRTAGERQQEPKCNLAIWHR
jgi:hypothetical protein